MKKIILKSITLRNFRGEKERTTNFNEVETSIFGNNGLGKSRHFDAFMWVLFGKDSQDRKDFNIKTIVDGEPLSKVDCEVSCRLSVDGENILLRRVFAEDWIKPRGQVEQVFRGHHTDTFFNEVPLNVGEFQARINGIIDEHLLKMLTNPAFFASMKWQDKREQLFQLAGTITDAEIAGKDPNFKKLLDKISGKSFADFKREIAAKKRNLKEELVQVQPRIDQTQKLMPQKVDFAKLEQEISELEKEVGEIDKALENKTEATTKYYELEQQKQREINNLKQQCQKVVFEEKQRYNEADNKANTERHDLENNIRSIQNENNIVQQDILFRNLNINKLKNRVADKTKEIEILRKTWFEENAKEYKGDEICHSCGQALPEALRENAKKIFSDTKNKILADITKKGKELSAEVSEITKRIETEKKGVEEAKKGITDRQNKVENMKNWLAQMPIAESIVEPETLPEYIKLLGKILALETDLKNMKSGDPADTSDLQEKKYSLTDEINTRKKELYKRDVIAKYTKEISDLGEKGKKLAQQIADVEREEYTIQMFTKTKIEECERRINKLFSYVTFQLFDYTIEGNEYECCIPLVNGVPYDVANVAGKVNAGLDIINTLVRFYGVSAPIFIDGRESVNKLIATESQIINLIVSKDNELIIK
jgi:DNA repair exonuclease SbcCD ATPase subunit